MHNKRQTGSIIIEFHQNRSIFVLDFLVLSAQLLDSFLHRWHAGRYPLRIDAAFLQLLGVRFLLVEGEIQTFLDVQPILFVLVDVFLVGVVQSENFVDNARLFGIDLRGKENNNTDTFLNFFIINIP